MNDEHNGCRGGQGHDGCEVASLGMGIVELIAWIAAACFIAFGINTLWPRG